MNRRRNPDRRQAFTLIEVLLVLAILVIMASFVAVNYIGRQKKAMVQKAKVDIQLLGDALKMYHMDLHTYPTTDQGLEALRQPPAGLPNPEQWGPEPYLEKEIPLDPWGKPYQYQYPGRVNTQSYDIWSLGPDGIDGSQDDICNWSQ